MYHVNEFYEDVRRHAKAHLKGLYQSDRRGRGFVCPLCGNGSGHDGDGITFIKADRNGNSNSDLLHCFKCGFSGDIIKLRATERNISYRDAAKELAEELGIHDYSDQFSSFPRRTFRQFKKLPPLPPLAEPEPVEQIDYSDFFAEAAKNLEQTDYYKRRGFSLDTCRHFNLGFVAAWNHPKVPNAPKSSRFIVPTSKFSYLARDTRVHIPDSQKKYTKQKVGSVSLFNSAAFDSDFLFIVEGELDAVSFYEVGFHALALGSISNINKFINFIKSRSVLPKCIILALDNDQVGKETSLKLTKQLDQLGIPNVIADNLYGEHKDANEALVADKDSFKQNVETALADSKKVLENETASEPLSSSDAADTTAQKANTGNKDLDAAIDSLRSVSEFNGATVLSKNILNAAAFCKVYEPAVFADFRDKCKKGSVDLKTFDDSVGEFIKPVKKRKKREEKEREFQIERDLAVKRREESLRKRFDDIRIIESLYCQAPSQERDDKIISIIKSNLERNYRGEVKATVNNFELILNCDPCLRGCVGYNSFSYKLTPLRHMPWFDKLTNHRVWTNEDDIGLRNYINRTYDGLSSERILMDVLNEYAHHHSFHPVRDYFNNNVEWAMKLFIKI